PAFQQDLYRFLSKSAEKQPLDIPDQDNSRHVGLNGSPATALVLGAGGAARAVVYSLLQEGWQIIVAARMLAAARQLCEGFERQTTQSSQQIVPLLLNRDSLSAVTYCHLIVNATPLGTISGEEASPWPLDLPLPAGAVVYDLVYNPPETPLVRYAKNAGLAAETGMGMLVEQAALAFERWTRVPAPRSVMYAAARKALSLDS
ncbi:MAG: shikimate dehydrogenase family protein, partial [Anaerolineales bacterium]